MNVFDYDDYRKLVSDRVDELDITRSMIADILGLKAKSYLGLILSGKRALQFDHVHLLKDVLRLSSTEFEYFFHLVMLNDSKSKPAQIYHRKKVEEIKRHNRSLFKTIQAKEDILSRWFYPALLLALTLTKPLTLKDLAGKLGLKVNEVDAAYAELEKQGLVKRDANGLWQAQPVKLKIAKKAWNMIQRRFLREQIGSALSIFDSSYEKTGKFYSQTLTLSKEGFDQVWSSIKETMDRIADQSDIEKPEELVQLNVQFYRIT